jgi:hypothetical protein
VIKSWSRVLTISLLLLILVVAVPITMAWFALPLDGITVAVHGQTFSLAELQGPQVALALCVAVAAVVFAIVAALIMVVVGLAVGALGIAFGLFAAAASLALVLSPFALIGWLLWRLFRERPVAVASTARP